MKYFLLFTFILSSFSFLNAQSTFKNHISKDNGLTPEFTPAKGLPSFLCTPRSTGTFEWNTLGSIRPTHQSVENYRITSSGSLWIDLKPNELWSSRSSVSQIISDIIPDAVKSNPLHLEWTSTADVQDEQNINHIRVHQTLHGYPVHGQDMILHIQNGQLRDINGFAWTGRIPESVPSPASHEEVMTAAKQYLSEKGIRFQDKPELDGLHHPSDKMQLVWMPREGRLLLAYELEIHANMLDHWTIFVDATTLEIVKAYSQLCSLYPKHLYQDRASTSTATIKEPIEENKSFTTLLDGPTVINDQDLLGQTRTVNAYLVGTNFFMIDASRSVMFNGTQSVMPNEPVGVIWTIDGQNGSPQKENFEVVHVANTNNNWDPLEVSAHFNAGESFEYFRQKFNRNSLNGDGGNIISIINIRDENGNNLDNAFWSGQAMFYGNGDVAFEPLAKGLDVAGHEMSHGVIQNTANLEYMGQSGALNESFADVFGAMIDRADWQLGEDVVKLNFFPSGAMRDLSNPHNGGNSPNDNGWQPAHMNEFQNLPNTPEGDNGGVHVNSGITNRAFFLFATSVGKEKAEQVYYKALRDYLVKSSQFIDMRNAVEKAATDLHGANSPEVMAARSAFDAVGIGAGQGDDHQDDIETNTGDDFILATDEAESDLYWIPPTNPNQFVKLELPAPLSKPSFTDDGTAAVYVDQEENMILINFNWTGGNLNYEAFYLEDDPQGGWRNIVVSKDGSKIAYTTSQLTDEMWVFDFTSSASEFYELYNPTTAMGIETGDVLYADAMEWDYSGEFIMYDALNEIRSAFGDGIEYWDIAFINVWDNGSNQFGDGLIGKLFALLPENVSVGNPTFAKNSPYIITFDYIEDYFDQFGQLQTDYRILASNIETGVVNEIYQNTTVGYPSYSGNDDKILFTYDNLGALLLATINLQPADKTLPVAQTDIVLINGAQKGVWFQTGNRDFTSTESAGEGETDLIVSPQPAHDQLQIMSSFFIEGAAYSITDLSGKSMSQGTLSLTKSIDIAEFPSGMYLLQIKTKEVESNKLFLKQ